MPGMNARKMVLITNNPVCSAKLENDCVCIFDEAWNYGQVLQAALRKVEEGYFLVSHPMAGSLKPNQTPYLSVLLATSCIYSENDFDGAAVLEKAYAVYEKFQRQRPTPKWGPNIKKDFGTIDLSIMQGVMGRKGATVL
ncbi:GrdX family protein [Ruminococcaceae bacterium OttesenSCG-928-I18]|nr:GrdX family protein [Ruminococcaceae bacterium OttesenSCG-928-I18]